MYTNKHLWQVIVATNGRGQIGHVVRVTASNKEDAVRTAKNYLMVRTGVCESRMDVLRTRWLDPERYPMSHYTNTLVHDWIWLQANEYAGYV